MTADIGIAMIGHAFMGKAHSQAWRMAPCMFKLPRNPHMRVLVGRDPEKAKQAATDLCWDESESDWHAILDRSDIDVVDICAPGNVHSEIAVAALNAGKHVLCEKPLANTVDEAEQMAEVATKASGRGVQAMVGFTYRRAPAIQLARKLVIEGRLGKIFHIRAQYLQDWLSSADAPFAWRLDKSLAGSGALGDIGAHAIDLTQFVSGKQIQEVSGSLSTFTPERLSADDGSLRAVTVDDSSSFLADFEDGATGVFEVTRCATGRKNSLRFEINGTLGSIAFDLEEMNVLQFFDGKTSSESAGFARVLATEPKHAYMKNWWPAGHILGYENLFTNQAVDFINAIATGTQPVPSFAEGLQVQRVLAAVEESARKRSWISVAR